MKQIRPIAIYLPQFYPIPENDKWWGKGFTEWTLVSGAKPLYKNHYQPHIPADLGFYDLRVSETREAQAALAREYGIYGFCYYHYWLNGKRILERPFEEVLESGKPDFPFMLCWANHNWTRKWDGKDEEVLLKQEYSATDAFNHIHYLIPIFKDKRYIKINGRPVFVIYKSTDIPILNQYYSIFKDECKKVGLDLFICRLDTHDNYGTKDREVIFDAAIQYPPFDRLSKLFSNKDFKTRDKVIFRIMGNLMKKVGLKKMKEYFYLRAYNRFDYKKMVKFRLEQKIEYDYKCFPTLFPSWDNTPRRGKKGMLYKNSDPDQFQRWFEHIVENFNPFSEEENFVFINAWNEWSEGDHLEPCIQWGRGYLEATRNALTQKNF